MKDKKIGWIGTGLMGNPMVKHLLKAGYSVGVHNRTKEKATDLIEMGCTWYDTPSDLAANAEVVVTIIGFPKDVEECYFGEQGIFKTIKPGTILIDMTTTKPSLAIKIAEQASMVDAEFIDAPVSGGQLGAINGNLSIMIGGKKKWLIQCFHFSRHLEKIWFTRERLVQASTQKCVTRSLLLVL